MYICADEGGSWQRLGRFAILYKESTTKKGGGKIPLETCVFILGLESTTQQKRLAFSFGIFFYHDKSENKEKIWKRRRKRKKGREKSFSGVGMK